MSRSDSSFRGNVPTITGIENLAPTLPQAKQQGK
jgi:hypothetical protein